MTIEDVTLVTIDKWALATEHVHVGIIHCVDCGLTNKRERENIYCQEDNNVNCEFRKTMLNEENESKSK